MEVNMVSDVDGEFMYKASCNFALYSNFPPFLFSFTVCVFRRVMNGHNFDIHIVLSWFDFVTCPIATWNFSYYLF